MQVFMLTRADIRDYCMATSYIDQPSSQERSTDLVELRLQEVIHLLDSLQLRLEVVSDHRNDVIDTLVGIGVAQQVAGKDDDKSWQTYFRSLFIEGE